MQNQLITIGDPSSPDFSFNATSIMNLSMDVSVDLVGIELYTDVMEFDVQYDDSDESLRNLPWATPIYYYYGDGLEGKFYSTTVTRIGTTMYRVRATSAVGILEYEKFYGGVYNGEPFKDLVERVIGSNGLQPYSGVYAKVTRDQSGSDSINYFRGYGFGDYVDVGLTAQNNSGAFTSSVTMSCKLSAKFTLHEFLGALKTNAASATSLRLSLLGCHEQLDNADANVTKLQYGMYMDVTRASTSDDWPQFGEVFFVWGNNRISLGTPTQETTYEIDVDPVSGTAKINGTTYTFTYDNSVENIPAAIQVYGGGYHLYTYGSSVAAWFTSGGGDCVKADYYYYNIKNQNNELLRKYVTIKNTYFGEVRFFDLVNKVYAQTYVYECVLNENDLEPFVDPNPDNGGLGAYPLFANATPFQTELIDSIEYGNGVDEVGMYGWIPICSKREALHQLMFACGAILLKNNDGGIVFTTPTNVQAGSVDSDSVYQGGEEESFPHTNRVEVAEFGYLYDADNPPVTLFDNTGSTQSGYYIAEYSDAPAYRGSISSSGITTIFRANNAAVCYGNGTITGVPYKESKNVLTKEIAQWPDGRTVSVSSATLVNTINSSAILDRLVDYYSNAKKEKIDIVQQNERCGLKYGIVNAFGEAITGFLTKANKIVSSIIRASCEFIAGYSPPWDLGFSHYVILTGNGTWDVPASVLAQDNPKIRCIIIGGGSGGEGGYAGADGTVTQSGMSALVAEGGAVGQPGTPGKVYDVIIENPSATYTFSCGTGGAGGTISTSHDTNNSGSAGTDTTFTDGNDTYSSASGSVPSDGYVNLFNGDIYAKEFVSNPWNEPDHDDPIQGWWPGSTGRGGNSGYQSYNGNAKGAISCFAVIPNLLVFWRGNRGKNYPTSGSWRTTGGYGGGAGYGEDGSSGTDADYRNNKCYPGNGGNGGNATAVPPKATDYNSKFYGYGGHPGGGGGGGGPSGMVVSGWPYVAGTAGKGGYGGKGGDGGDGCILIYY